MNETCVDLIDRCNRMVAEYKQDVAEIKAVTLDKLAHADPGTKNTVLLMVDDYEVDVAYYEEEITFFRGLAQRHRGDLEVTRQVKEIMRNLIRDKERIKCKINQLWSIGTKQSMYAKTQERGASQSSLQG